MNPPPFRFKKFIIYQDQCAMKIGTDGVLLGAWVNLSQSKKILDIGTGTGLIALMLAQRNREALIDALDIDLPSTQQAINNFNNSPWSSRLSCKNCAFENFTTNKNYDLIITNPPYFLNSLKPIKKSRIVARHADHLCLDVWLKKIFNILDNKGKLAIILPFENKTDFLAKCNKNGLFLNRICEVYPTPTKACKRVLIELSKKQPKYNTPVSRLVIELEKRHQYSKEYQELTKDFYTIF